MPESISHRSPTEPPAALVPRRGRIVASVAGAVALALVLWGVLSFRRVSAGGNASSPDSGGATLTLDRRDFVHTLRIHGTVEALDYRSVAAPRLSGPGGGQIIVTRLLSTGAKVKPGDVVIEFDRQSQERNALDRRAEYLDLEEQIKKRHADNAAAEAKDITELKAAENAVETATLEMKKNEVISKIDAEKNAQNLEEAKANLAQLRETLELKRVARQADVRILELQRDRARKAMEYAHVNMEKLSIRAAIGGMVVLTPTWMQSQMREVQEGDQVWSGNPIMQIVNPAGMQVRARVNQADVTSLRLGQAVQVRLDAYPELVLAGKLDSLAAVGATSSMNQKVRTFAAVFSIQGTDPRLLPDLSAAVEIELERYAGALVVPRDALITEDGQTYLNVKRGLGFEKAAVTLGATSDTEAVILSGVAPGAVVQRRR
ncbi:MAG: HlyD family efflux transporter periplasmic adaptor subunit [Acidobacteria bacterium]|nr:HlyD family efflux transporter periplasmic adaptor subunit [Acidobacteriota bacterium]MBI3662625.1 HlyD family efflux transporter periplasmic adaptor subunit [Acidobacteriota bacterium]